MTKRDYVLVAKVLKEHLEIHQEKPLSEREIYHLEVMTTLITNMCIAFRNANPKFNVKKFFEAVKVKKENE